MNYRAASREESDPKEIELDRQRDDTEAAIGVEPTRRQRPLARVKALTKSAGAIGGKVCS